MAKNDFLWPKMAFSCLALSGLISPYLISSGHNQVSIGLKWPLLAFSGLALYGLISPYWTLYGHNEVSNGLKWPNIA